ncbi:MAG: hypothetical protein C0614_10440, partial [Desulfuromonas sp.]
MNNRFAHKWTVFLLGLLFTATASLADVPRVGILISREIAPYIEMVKQLEDELNSVETRRFFLDRKGVPYSLAGQAALGTDRFNVLVAVGPEALSYLQSQPDITALVYGMVLNPERLAVGQSQQLCGVSLNIPVHQQFSTLLSRIPSLKRVGVLFDPANNRDWFEQAVPVAADLGVE